MCTLTFIQNKKGDIIITSNRDERAERATEPPKIHTVHGKQVLFPKDKVAGGSWIALDPNGKVACLLNGADETDHWISSPIKSKGLVLLDAFRYDSLERQLEKESFNGVNPFTLLVFNINEPGKVEELLWNGQKAYTQTKVDPVNQIWSSVKLYDKPLRELRKNYFLNFIENPENHASEKILSLHKMPKSEHGLLLNEHSVIQTTSVTQIIINQQKAIMKYDEISKPQEPVYESEVQITAL